MSISREYVRNLTHKYRLAVAIAVLKDKPENVSVEVFIEELKQKFTDDSEADIDLTVCSDDFDFENDVINNDIITLNECTDDGNDKMSDTSKKIVHQPSKCLKEVIFNNLNKPNNNITDFLNVHGNDSNRLFDNIRNRNDENVVHNTNNNSETILKDCNEIILNEIENISKDVGHHTSQNSQHEKAQEKPLIFSDNNLTYCDTQTIAENNVSNIEHGNSKKDSTNINIVTKNKVQLVINEVHDNTENAVQTYYDSQATELYTVHGFSQNYSHVSQSQYYDVIVLNDKFIKTNNNKIRNDTNLAVNHSEVVDKSVSVINNFDKSNDNQLDNNILLIEDVENTDILNDIITNDQIQSNIVIHNQNSMDIQESFPQYAQNLNEIEINEVASQDINVMEINEVDIGINEVCEDKRNEMNMEVNENDDSSSSETEIVSFKVIEELNKVKTYINKRAERRCSNDGSIDSGYRSDSQKSTFRSSLQMSGNWLNQSAHCLYEYISQSPLLASTQKIVNEIAEVLGQLVDKLHADENYPSFLEELLANVEFLLKDLLQGRDEDEILLQKDDIVQRLLLLNKSAHIQTYTIEKITTILENIHTHLTNPEDTFEITNTNEIENLPYIFHILEAILKKHSKTTNLSQEINNSQNELKKSSLTDIWRKKWNPKYTEANVLEESTPKKCVFSKCNEILNKLVVSCMEGYSLLAFLALQCFNMLQIK